MSRIEAYDVKARKKVIMKNPQPYLMKKRIMGIKRKLVQKQGFHCLKIVGRNEPKISQSRFESFKKFICKENN